MSNPVPNNSTLLGSGEGDGLGRHHDITTVIGDVSVSGAASPSYSDRGLIRRWDGKEREDRMRGVQSET